MNTFIAALVTFFGCFIVVPMLFGLARAFGFYAIVNERRCLVYVLFGKVVGVLAAYVRNVKLTLFSQANRVIEEVQS